MLGSKYLKWQKKGVLRNFAKFSEKLCQRLFFNKAAGLRPVNFVKFLGAPSTGTRRPGDVP